MYQLILFFHVLIAITLIALVLMHQGKGAGMGAAFGGGASQTLFGSQGSLSFMLKLTGGFAALFFLTSILLTYMATYTVRQNTVIPTKAPISQPRTPASGAAPQSVVPNKKGESEQNKALEITPSQSPEKDKKEDTQRN